MRNVYREREPHAAVIGETVLQEALDRIAACQECSGSLSRTFRSVLMEALGGGKPLARHILEVPASCPNCSSPLNETTLVRCEGDDLGEFSPAALPGYSAWLQ